MENTCQVIYKKINLKFLMIIFIYFLTFLFSRQFNWTTWSTGLARLLNIYNLDFRYSCSLKLWHKYYFSMGKDQRLNIQFLLQNTIFVYGGSKLGNLPYIKSVPATVIPFIFFTIVLLCLPLFSLPLFIVHSFFSHELNNS
jgi:hypothetical protein